MNTTNATEAVARTLGKMLAASGWTITTAESCTGGLIAGAITNIAGSSAWFDRGFVTYSDVAKQEMLGVDAHVLSEHGAVSEQTVRAMAEGALRRSSASVSIAISGIAGPGGGSEDKPVGLVWFGYALAEPTLQITAKSAQFVGSRQAVRALAVQKALVDCQALLAASV